MCFPLRKWLKLTFIATSFQMYSELFHVSLKLWPKAKNPKNHKISVFTAYKNLSKNIKGILAIGHKFVISGTGCCCAGFNINTVKIACSRIVAYLEALSIFTA